MLTRRRAARPWPAGRDTGPQGETGADLALSSCRPRLRPAGRSPGQATLGLSELPRSLGTNPDGPQCAPLITPPRWRSLPGLGSGGDRGRHREGGYGHPLEPDDLSPGWRPLPSRRQPRGSARSSRHQCSMRSTGSSAETPCTMPPPAYLPRRRGVAAGHRRQPGRRHHGCRLIGRANPADHAELLPFPSALIPTARTHACRRVPINLFGALLTAPPARQDSHTYRRQCARFHSQRM